MNGEREGIGDFAHQLRSVGGQHVFAEREIKLDLLLRLCVLEEICLFQLILRFEDAVRDLFLDLSAARRLDRQQEAVDDLRIRCRAQFREREDLVVFILFHGRRFGLVQHVNIISVAVANVVQTGRELQNIAVTPLAVQDGVRECGDIGTLGKEGERIRREQLRVRQIGGKAAVRHQEEDHRGDLLLNEAADGARVRPFRGDFRMVGFALFDPDVRIGIVFLFITVVRFG